MAEENTVTMSRQEAEQLRRGMALLNKLDGDPRTKPLIEDAVKIHFPDVTTEREVVERQVKPLIEPVAEMLGKINKRFEAEDLAKEEAAKKAAEEGIESAFKTLSGQGYTPEGLEAIKQLMVDRKIADPYAAAAYFDKTNPTPSVEANSYSPQGWDLGAGHAPAASMDALFKDPDGWADKQVGVVLSEIRGSR